MMQVVDKGVTIAHIDTVRIYLSTYLLIYWSILSATLTNDHLQIREVSRDHGVYTDQELRALLKFYHGLGKIIFFGKYKLSLNLSL